ncbi:PLP-dependent aminotransferase family protein [Corynebacterium diphtheriae]|uniref:MocR-like pyridoxine biosynthesis transcription factor PdxR n=5 Tax=Corynebacterium diphtheriae TaxID=1717 RepID=UPI00038FA5CD|nr:PLP-dependent aminotransferase family protein [Corynebacterium diphtheriae]ERA54661.1 GntR family transcriptional regulator [Corynebacterium diphtheriae str. Aberdeen]KLN43525.1 GntR family transcriptional regulator [Corynebacterium diphtheriae bv. gravis str. ISS 4746]KLN45384.1 GntR family transcriptional regulator [Corynebacterium diphtheriae bv. gravis str. ISS 4749]UWE70222.1 PLP-dependent aminotransferase family protein [Corynebacterium diphtheriae bv. gravis]
MRPDLVTNLPITLNRASTDPIPTQIADHIRTLVGRGLLKPGDHVPSTRALSTQLGISRGSAVTAYEQLLAEGFLIAARGSGTCINPDLTPTPPPAHSPTPPPEPPAIDLTPGLPDTTTLANSSWRAAWRTACTHPPTHTPPQGLLHLREQVADHLRRMRAVVASPDHIIITAGAREGFSLILQALGPDLRVGVESPGYPSLRRVPEALGSTTVPLPTDNNGLITNDLPDLDAVLVTPSHQYPHGGSLPAYRRTQLTTWANRTAGLIIEDDFDSELRHIGQPLPALFALAPQRTALLGTFSSVISPQVSCGYIVAPPHLVPHLIELRTIFGNTASGITQEALAQYLSTGALRRRTQNLRRTYRRRRDTVIDILGSIPGTTLSPIVGGLHAVLTCTRPEADILQRCRQRGIIVEGLSDYWSQHPDSGPSNGIVIGFGSHDDATLTEALHHIAWAVS